MLAVQFAKNTQLTKRKITMSEKITLRAIEKTDLNFLHRLVNDPTIMNFWFEEAYYSKGKLEEIIEKQKDHSSNRRFILHNEDEPLGFVALYNIDYIHRKAEFAIMIDPKQQGKGFAIPATNWRKTMLSVHLIFISYT